MKNARIDPLHAFRFRVRFDMGKDAVYANCTEVTGLSAEVDTHEYREGGNNAYVHRFRGPAKYPSLVLKRGLSASQDLWAWLAEVQGGQTSRVSGAIELLDLTESRTVLMSWEFRDAFPVRWSGPDFRADSAGIAFETLELVHRGLFWKAGRKAG